jgi:hypothetical protein
MDARVKAFATESVTTTIIIDPPLDLLEPGMRPCRAVAVAHQLQQAGERAHVVGNLPPSLCFRPPRKERWEDKSKG